MAKASSGAATIDPAETAHFASLAGDWWDPEGASAMLHRMGPIRLAYLRARIDDQFGGDLRGLKPLAGKKAADVGCGGGLVAEPLARLGAQVTGVDPAAEAIAVARAHAEGQGLRIDYRIGGPEMLDAGQDLVTSFEVIEHSADPKAFVAALARALSPNGLLILSTPARTAMSRFAMITIGEGFGKIPEGTHDWEKFLAPATLAVLLEDAGMTVIDTSGLAWSPMRGFHLSDNLSLDYFISAVKA